MRSLRLRITLALALGQLAVLVLATVIAQQAWFRSLADQFSSTLRDTAAAFESLREPAGRPPASYPLCARPSRRPVAAPRAVVARESLRRAWCEGRWGRGAVCGSVMTLPSASASRAVTRSSLTSTAVGEGTSMDAWSLSSTTSD